MFFQEKQKKSRFLIFYKTEIGKHCPGSANLIYDIVGRVAKGESLLLIGYSI